MASPGRAGGRRGGSRLSLGDLTPPQASSGSSLSARPAASHLCARGDPQVVGGAATWGQHHLRGQELLLRLQPVMDCRSTCLVQQHEVASSHPRPRPVLQQRLPNSASIVSQQLSVHLQGERSGEGEGHSGQFRGQKLGKGLWEFQEKLKSGWNR